MSRCFPFPPPGYEKKPKAETLDLLTKEKRKEKKHKKEKKEKEKREHRDKKEKDRSKDKRKEKKERKEKNKDRKKDKDIDKGRSSEDQNEGANRHPESLQKAGEFKDSKFTEELGRRIRDNGADNRMAGSITSSFHRKIEPMGGVAAHPSFDKDSRVTDKKVFPVPVVGSSQRNDGTSLPVENAANSPYRRIGSISTATSMDQERSKLHERLFAGINADQNRNHGISRSIEGVPGLVNRKAEYSATAGMEKEKIPEKNLVSNSIIAPANDNNKGKLGATVVASNSVSNKRKNDFLGLSAGSLSSIRSKPESTSNSFIRQRMDGMDAAPAIDKERFKGGGMLPNPFNSDQRRDAAVFQPAQKDKNHKVDRQDETTKGLKDNEQVTKKNKQKDSDKQTKEEEEKIEDKAAAIENNYIRNFGKKDQIDTLNSKPLAPHKDNTASIIRGVDENSNKRSNLKINGFIQENEARLKKMPRLMASSSQTLAGLLPLKKPDRVSSDHKEKEINGSAKPQQLPDGNNEVSLKAPHPDSRYLEQLYAVPKMEPWLENDDMEWLFNRRDSSQQMTNGQPASEEESMVQVWAQATWIKSADVLALPYVIPF